MANITRDGSPLIEFNQAVLRSPAGVNEFFSALNIFLSITATMGNALILIAFHKVSSIYPPTKLFFRCLAVTDLCVGLIVQPSYAIHKLFLLQNNDALAYYAYKVFWASNLILSGISVLTSTAISVDRLLALLLGLRYRHVVTLRRVRVVMTCFCLIVGSTVGVWVWNDDFARRELTFVITISLITSTFCYTRIHQKLRHYRVQAQNNVPQGQLNGGGIPINIARYKKIVSSIMWVQLALVTCYVPFGIVSVLTSFNVKGVEYNSAYTAAGTLIFLSSSLNPILYCYKMREVRQAVRATIRELYG